VPYELSDGAELRRIVGHQRQLDEKHALDIKKYLEQSDNRLIPEIILSVRGTFNNPHRYPDPNILCKGILKASCDARYPLKKAQVVYGATPVVLRKIVF